MKSNKKLLSPPSPNLINRFNSRLSSRKGWVAAIEPKTKQYVLGRTLLQAAGKARKAFPGRAFYFIRIGYPYVHRQIGGLKKAQGEG